MKKVTAALAAVLVMSAASTALAASADPFTVSGDMRLRFDRQTNFNQPDFTGDKYRIRLNLGYKFSPEWSANVRAVLGESFFGAGPTDSSKYPVVADNAQIDIASVTYKQSNLNATVGRQMFSMFEGLAVSMDDGHSAGDMGYPDGSTRTDGGRAKNYPALQGVRLQDKFGDVSVTAFYGNLNSRISDGINYNVRGLAAMVPVGTVNVGGMWYSSDADISAADAHTYGLKTDTKTGYSVTANTRLFDKYLYTGAEYIWGLADTHDKAWKAVVKTPDTKKPGDMQYAVEYRNIQQNALDYNSCTGGSINSTYVGLSSAYKSIAYGDYNYWGLSVKRQLSKDVAVTLFYEKYNPQNRGTSGVNDTQVEDHIYRLQLDYAF